ncbi:MAG TPA: DUF4919 domain-containing protein [Pyrinomonadaceae bacterium]|nr:DUF4919 domain-containing protein [Pyrinomonadaceae bacterium]
MKFRTLALALLAVAATAPSASAQTPTPTPAPASTATPPPSAKESKETPAQASAATPAASKSNYPALVERVRKGDRAVDFGELRMAYTETADYNPYGGGEERGQMFAALNERKFADALSVAEKVLQKNYVDLNAHFVSSVANRELGRGEQADFHRFIFTGLADSIRRSGDGKSTSTAFVVISTAEEYVVLNLMGLRPAGQALLHDGGHSYDRMRGVDPQTNQQVELYFNIDKPFGWLGNSLKKDKP